MQGVLFDFNGTLLFDTPLHSFCWKEMARKMRGSVLSDQEFSSLNGRTNKQLVEYILQRGVSDEESQKYAIEKEELYKQMLRESSLELCQGAIQLFELLTKNKIPFTIATSSDWGNVQVFIEKFHLDKWFDVKNIIFNDFSFKGKPAPDIYLKAARALNVDISKCIVFEDTVSGIQSAFTAGAKVIGIASEMTIKELKEIKGCCCAINDFREITIEKLKEIIEN